VTRMWKIVATCGGVGMATSHASVSGQELSTWLDVNAVHARPPAGAAVDAASYGLLGARMRMTGRASMLELGASAGRGAEAASGAWATGRVALSSARVAGAMDYGVRAEGTGLGYLGPVQLRGGAEYTQQLAAGTVTPFAGLSIGGFRLGVEGTLTAGAWRSELATAGAPGPLPPLGGAGRTVTRNDGTIRIAGGSAALLRLAGPLSLEVRGSAFDVRNPAVEGLYRGVDAMATLSAGVADVSAGARLWNTPLEDAEIGAHLGFGIAAGDGAYVQVMAGRNVADMVHGAPGGFTISGGISLRAGRRAIGPPAPAAVGAASGTGRRVVFTLRRADAGSVAVAGDFSGWEARPLVRGGDGTWTLETTLPPGVYHYAFVVNGTEWTVPQNATGVVDDGFGQRNATLVVNGSQQDR
jgi:hypothetical protein